MKAVGATDAFIRLPFVVEGVAIGALSSAVAFGLMYLIQDGISSQLAKSGISLVPFGSYALTLILLDASSDAKAFVKAITAPFVPA